MSTLINQEIYSLQVLSGKGKTNNVFRIQTVWNNNSFTLYLLDSNQVYKSEVPENMFHELANKYKKNFQEYVEEIRSCLSVNNLNFTYSIKNNNLIISKREEAFFVQFFDVVLNKIDFNEGVINFIDGIIKSNENLQNELKMCKEEVTKTNEEKNMYFEKLAKFVELKQKSEDDLYTKFILLINEKKMRIQYLTELVERFSQNMQNDETKQMFIDIEKNVKARMETISDSESDTESNSSKNEAQIEQNSSQEENYDFLEDEKQTSTATLPKRTKVDNTIKNKDVITKTNESNSKQKHPTETNESSKQEDAQNDSLDFNTQDLYDLL